MHERNLILSIEKVLVNLIPHFGEDLDYMLIVVNVR